MKNFHLVQEHFSKMRCTHCDALFQANGILLLREEQDYWIVRVTCSTCSQLAGIALVGIEPSAGGAPATPQQNLPALPAPTRPRRPVSQTSQLTTRERQKFQQLGPITSDELIEVHRFLSKLGADWYKHMPARFNAGYRRVSPPPEA